MKRVLAAGLFVSIFFLSACWDANELNDIGIVVMTGFDLDDDGQERVTVLSVQPFGQASMQGETSRTWVGTASGKSSFEAMRNLRRTSTRTLVWVHNKIVLIGEKKASTDIGNIVDLLTRTREFRYDNTVFITNGRADKMMEVPANLEKSLFLELLGIIENSGEWSKGYALSIKDLSLNTSSAYEHGFVIGNMGFYNTERVPFSIDHQEYLKLYWKDNEEPISFISGGGVINEGKLVAWLTPVELRGYLIISGQVDKSFTRYAEIPEENLDVTIDIINVKTEISFPSVGKEIRAMVKTRAAGMLSEVDGFIPERNPSYIKYLEKKLANEIELEMKQIVNLAQNELRSDFLNFHKSFSIEHPSEWKKVKSNWCEIFCNIEVDYDVKLKIQSEGLLSRTYNSMEN